MPYPDSKYPSVIRGMTATQSLRLMNAAPFLLEVCERVSSELFDLVTSGVDLTDEGASILDECLEALDDAVFRATGGEFFDLGSTKEGK